MSGVDVVVPCYQYGRFLRDSVGSVLSQNIEQLRVLIIDNASTDDTVEVARELARQDPRVEVVARSSNHGQQASYNEGIDWAHAEYFMILDADDLLAPGCLSRAVSVMDRETDLVFCHGTELQFMGEATAALVASAEPQPQDWRTESGLAFIRRICASGYNLVGCQTVVRRTSAQKAIGYYHPELRHANDLNMWLRLATLGAVAETKATQALRRVHQAQMTNYYRENLMFDLVERHNNFQHFFSHEGAAVPEIEKERRRVAGRIALNAVKAGVKLVPEGRILASLRCFDFAVRTLLETVQQPVRVGTAPLR